MCIDYIIYEEDKLIACGRHVKDIISSMYTYFIGNLYKPKNTFLIKLNVL